MWRLGFFLQVDRKLFPILLLLARARFRIVSLGHVFSNCMFVFLFIFLIHFHSLNDSSSDYGFRKCDRVSQHSQHGSIAWYLLRSFIFINQFKLNALFIQSQNAFYMAFLCSGFFLQTYLHCNASTSIYSQVSNIERVGKKY